DRLGEELVIGDENVGLGHENGLQSRSAVLYRADRLAVKSEARNPKLETNPNEERRNVSNRGVRSISSLNFEFVSDFVLRISDFPRSGFTPAPAAVRRRAGCPAAWGPRAAR